MNREPKVFTHPLFIGFGEAHWLAKQTNTVPVERDDGWIAFCPLDAVSPSRIASGLMREFGLNPSGVPIP